MSDVYDIWLYPLQDRWRTVNEMSDFMYIGHRVHFAVFIATNSLFA